ncbi:MAG: carboxypeptidase-like regulatory domain-containing protein, partial [Flavobacteriales bacterium]
MKQIFTKKTMVLFLLCVPTLMMAQSIIKGTVKDASTGEVLPGANVVIQGTTQGTTADFDGNFTIEIMDFPKTLIFSSVGYKTMELSITNDNFIQVSLEEGVALDEVILVGNRSKPRTILDSSVPIDN